MSDENMMMADQNGRQDNEASSSWRDSQDEDDE